MHISRQAWLCWEASAWASGCSQNFKRRWAFCPCNKTWEKPNLRGRKRFLLAHSFIGFGPWSCGLIALGPLAVRCRASWRRPLGGKTGSPHTGLEAEEGGPGIPVFPSGHSGLQFPQWPNCLPLAPSPKSCFLLRTAQVQMKVLAHRPWADTEDPKANQ